MDKSVVVVGVDLIQIRDVADSINRFGDRFVKRVFTTREIGYCRQESAREAERFAARFAAKEATMKALRVGPSDALDWRDIEVIRSDDGWCCVELRGGAMELALRRQVSELALSMSHDGQYATATVIGRRLTGAEDRADAH